MPPEPECKAELRATRRAMERKGVVITEDLNTHYREAPVQVLVAMELLSFDVKKARRLGVKKEQKKPTTARAKSPSRKRKKR